MTAHSSTANAELLALAETIHRARFPFDRTPTPFETQDASGREYCLRIARSIMAEHGIPAQRQPDRNAISLAASAANLQFQRDNDAQKEDFAKWKAGGYAGECPQHIKGTLVDYITDAVVEALAGRPSVQQTQWQPIETAPKLETVLAWWLNGEQHTGSTDGERWFPAWDHQDRDWYMPQLWMALVEPDKEIAAKAVALALPSTSCGTPAASESSHGA